MIEVESMSTFAHSRNLYWKDLFILFAFELLRRFTVHAQYLLITFQSDLHTAPPQAVPASWLLTTASCGCDNVNRMSTWRSFVYLIFLCFSWLAQDLLHSCFGLLYFNIFHNHRWMVDPFRSIVNPTGA